MLRASHRCAVESLQASRLPAKASLLIVAAHPDDETIGIGATLAGWIDAGWRAQVLHVTDGAPHNAALRYELRERTREEAAAIRRVEIQDALRAGDVDPNGVLLPAIGVADQEATLHMPEIAHALQEHFADLGTTVVVTHPYEGGHPDHDATAFAVHAAVARSPFPIALAEMSSYHTRQGTLVTAAFRSEPPPPCPARLDGALDAQHRARKRRMLDAYRTQTKILEPFGTDAEPLRCAPSYDFTRPPHEGKLHYESLPFDWTGTRWREFAREALAALT
ncbi:PIG-L family deacetylase [Pendulispora brunnea]|uniref:PIG-L family deacetylase n=1 Tax=Pendulispora brunnea TaxID=2905690 RepID=A0ABZ2K4I1_9BACT